MLQNNIIGEAYRLLSEDNLSESLNKFIEVARNNEVDFIDRVKSIEEIISISKKH